MRNTFPCMMEKSLPHRSGFFIIAGLLLLCAFFLVFPKQYIPQQNYQTQVLGSKSETPEIYIYGGESGYIAGGVISLASTDEPAIQIGGYNLSGKFRVMLYQASDDALLDYITHDAKGQQIKKTPDPSKIQYLTTVDQSASGDSNVKVLLPLSPVGIWYATITNGSKTTSAFIVRSHIATLLKEGDNQFIFWGQDFTTKKSLTDGVVILYNLQDGRKELGRANFS